MPESNLQSVPFAFFGSPEFSVVVLEQLLEHNLRPSLVVTAPDKPKGRGQKEQPPPVGVWAKKHNIPLLQPEKITDEFIKNIEEQAPENGWSLFVVVAYGHILPTKLIYLPHRNTLNVHPSLLPRLRGPAPIREAILSENKTGVSIIELDEKLDHGPIVAQEAVTVEDWPPTYTVLKDKLAKTGGELLAQTIPDWIDGKVAATPQDDSQASYSRKFSAEDGEINLEGDPHTNLRKIRAFTEWPKAHFFKNGKRILITKAHLQEGELIIDKVKPAGGKEISYQKFEDNS